MSVGRSILAIFNDTDTDSNGKSSERLSADLCDKYGLSVRFLVVTEKDFMVQDSTSPLIWDIFPAETIRWRPEQTAA